MGMQTDKVRFNVGGKIFETTATTLANACRSSVFGAMFDDQWNLQPRKVNDEYFIDRNPECFSVLLDLLRTGELHLPPNIPEKLLYKEALFYGLLENVRTAKWGRFDGYQLNLTSTVKVRAPRDCTAIRASPNGGCAVAHGSFVHVYNWMLEEHAPLILDHRKVNDIGWIDSENIVVSAAKRSGDRDGAMGLFSSSTGVLRHRYEFEGQTAGSLCFNSNNKIFASCTGGIGMWDQVTGKQTDFFNESSDFPLSDHNKIQWLNGSNCLFVSALFRCRNHRHMSLLDFRIKTRKFIYDAIAIEESNSICVAGYDEELGFIDLRSTIGSIRWNPKTRENDTSPWYPKLTLHGGQIFYSRGRNDGISVFSGPEYSLLTSSLGGVTRDFSIGCDRLFALHSQENVFDVWETPCPPII
ncbi:hypothetical protein MKW92_027589 [Papaver armeniacum]|nr:hypothetical protein MKW92_027589 [Papaver armeniacum]